MKSSYKITEADGVYFITDTIVAWLPVFISHTYCQILIDSFRYCQTEKELFIYAYVIMDNHFHMVAAGPDLSNTIASIKKYTAKVILQQAQQDGKEWLINQFVYFKKAHKTKSQHQIWQEGSHPQLIHSTDMLVQKIEYIHYNPVERGLVDKPEHWRYSSARNFNHGDNSTLDIAPLDLLL